MARSRFAHLHDGEEVAGVVFGDAGDAVLEAFVDRCPQLDRRSVRAYGDRIAATDLEAVGVPGRELDLGRGALELELGDALDGRAGEEWPVAEELHGSAGRFGRDRFVAALGGLPRGRNGRRQAGPLPG